MPAPYVPDTVLTAFSALSPYPCDIGAIIILIYEELKSQRYLVMYTRSES
jgi:hypothetical protein